MAVLRRYDRSERRGRDRLPTNLAAWADPGGARPVIECRILDLTEQGARLLQPSGVDIPAMFRLETGVKGVMQTAQIVWRKGPRVGARFVHLY